MYSKSFYKLIAIATKLGARFGVCSYKFNPKTCRLQSTPPLKKRCFAALLFVLAITTFWGATTANILWYGEGYANPDFYICYIYTLCGVMVLGALAVFNRTEDVLALGLNQLLGHMIKFQAKWMPTYDPKKELISLAMDALLFLEILGTTGIIPFAPTFFLFFPNTQAHFFSLLPNGTSFKCCALVWLLNMASTILFSSIISYVFLLFLYACTFYFFSVFPLIWKEFRGGLVDHPYKTRAGLRACPATLGHEYHCIELIHKELMDTAGIGFLHFQLCFGQFSLVCNYSVIKQWHHMDPFTVVMLCSWSLMVQVIWAIVLELGGRFQQQGKITLGSWTKLRFSSPLEKKIMSKFRKGCYPLVVGVRGLFIVKKISVLKYLRAIVKGTFRALLLSGKSSSH